MTMPTMKDRLFLLDSAKSKRISSIYGNLYSSLSRIGKYKSDIGKQWATPDCQHLALPGSSISRLFTYETRSLKYGSAIY